MKSLSHLIGDIFTKLVRLVKAGLTYPHYRNFYLKNTIEQYSPKEEKLAIVNFDKRLKNDDYYRYYYIICLYLEQAGFKVILKTHWLDFKEIRNPFEFQRLLMKQPYTFVRKCTTPLNTIALVQPKTETHLIHFSYGYSIVESGRYDCIAPYPMYPSQNKHYLKIHTALDLENTNRTIRVFFAGGADKNKYTKEKINRFFKVIPRPDVIQFVLSHFDKSSTLLKCETDKQVLEKLLNSNEQKSEIVISEIKTDEKDWLKILAKTHFFICPPGVYIPWSHNCIEAMSVGSIPVLEYAHLFHPALENGSTCLTYSNQEELAMAIEKALTMPLSEIANMRKKVLNYYNTYLSIENITEKIIGFSTSNRLELNVAVPFIPNNEEWAIQYQSIRRYFNKVKI